MQAKIGIGTFVVTAALAASASAATVQVRVAGDTINVPVPAGYCEATGAYLDVVQAAAAVDNQNVTLLGLFDCKEMVTGDTEHFIYVKAVKSALSARVSLEDLLKGLGAVPDSEIKAKLSDQSEAERGLKAVAGQNAEISHTIAPVDRDASAYYMAGVVELSVGDKQVGGSVAVALTSVKGHVLGYDFYGPGTTALAVRTVVKQAKAETPRLLAANR